MQPILTINGVDFIPYIKEDGIEYYPIYRRAIRVVTLDGKEHRASIEKQGINVELTAMKDETLTRLCAALASLVTVRYTDKTGTVHNSQFYVSGPTVSGKIVRNGTVHWGKVSFTLEEE